MNSFAARALWRPLRPLCTPVRGSASPSVPTHTQRFSAPPRQQPSPSTRRLLSRVSHGQHHHDGAKAVILLDLKPEAKAPVQAGEAPQVAAVPPVAPTARPATGTATAAANAATTATTTTATTATTTIPPDHRLEAPHPPAVDPIPVVNSVPPLPLWQRLGPLTWAADSYGRAQRRRPYLVQVLSALVIALCADLSVQRMLGGPYDPKRTVRSLVIGAVSAIPGWLWFVFLARHFNYASHPLSIAVKVAVNQVVYTPVFNTYFFGMQALLAGETLAAAWARVCTTVPVSFVNSFKVWPAVTAVNFAFVPLEYRSVVAGVVAVGWQTYLVYLNRSAEAAQGSAAAAKEAPAVVQVETVQAVKAQAQPVPAEPVPFKA